MVMVCDDWELAPYITFLLFSYEISHYKYHRHTRSLVLAYNIKNFKIYS